MVFRNHDLAAECAHCYWVSLLPGLRGGQIEELTPTLPIPAQHHTGHWTFLPFCICNLLLEQGESQQLKLLTTAILGCLSLIRVGIK